MLKKQYNYSLMKIIHKLLVIISRIAGCKKNKLSRKLKFIEDLNFYPTDLAEMFNRVEDEFKIELTKEDELQIKSIEIKDRIIIY